MTSSFGAFALSQLTGRSEATVRRIRADQGEAMADLNRQVTKAQRKERTQ